ncbi:macro domain-containing protein [Heyndrickxia oleronia]|uniref:macro domain-containing protein n=1 Tax=Heyndrickxia oleronia TaxID=38875 RepID=UPI003F293498
MIRIVEGNILDAPEDLIGHQVNCKGVMGAGLAKQIREKYPNVFKDYKELCLNQAGKLLGATQYIETSDGKVIVNLFAQDGFGRDKQYTDYKALEDSLKGLKYAITSDQCKYKGKSIALPYGIGCGLAGGNWSIVYNMISDIFNDVYLTLYKYK